MALGGLDAGSTFGGMGSSREMMISALIEPALLVSLLTLGLMSGSTSIDSIMSVNRQGSPLSTNPFALLILIALFIILLAETSRIPVDDPATHLELTMVHEAMLLEYSGRHLALMEYAAVIKQLLFMTILANFFFPLEPNILTSPFLSLFFGVILYVLKIMVIAVFVAVTEICTVKLRFFSIPNLAAISFVLSFLGFMQFFIIGR
jgi:formate hydrogenlyase subunit 4